MSARDRTGRTRYSAVAMALHWLTAAAFAFQIGLGWRMDAPRGPQTFAVFQLHKSIGITILLLTLARIGWRLLNPPPPFPATMRPLEKRLAQAVHLLFYLLLLGLPLSGWLIVSSSKVAVPTFLYGTMPWPHVPGIAGLAPGVRQSVNDLAATSHAVMGWVALAAIALHVAGALKHQFLERGGDLGRMVAVQRHALGAAAVAIVIAFVGLMAFGRRVPLAPVALATPATSAPAPSLSAPSPTHAAIAPTGAPRSAPPAAESIAPERESKAAAVSSVWKVRMRDSSIRFHTAWSQGPVDGGFGKWQATIRFDPAALAAASVAVTIDMASVTAADGEQRSALPETDWFAVATHPTATWRANGFRHRGGNRYLAAGTLTLRGVARSFALPFTLSIADDVATMTATAKIDRTAFGVGQGEWASTTDVPALVTLTIAIKADRAVTSSATDDAR